MVDAVRWTNHPEMTTARAIEVLGAGHVAWLKEQPRMVRQQYITGAWFANNLEELAAYRQLILDEAAS